LHFIAAQYGTLLAVRLSPCCRDCS
jgi:hypothetical protein